MLRRYFCETPINGQIAVLSGTEAHHLANVMRVAVGERVVLFDGAGGECEASVVRIAKRDVELRVESHRVVDREAAVRLTLAVALPKGERQRWLIEKAVELGVSRIAPITTERGVAKLKPSGVARLRRGVIEASKQCGRNRLMEIAAPSAWTDFVGQTPAEAVRLVAHPADARRTTVEGRMRDQADLEVHPTEALADLEIRPAGEIVAAVGPEGGFTDAEVQAAVSAGWRVVSLGPRTLRVETAALAIAALILR